MVGDARICWMNERDRGMIFLGGLLPTAFSFCLSWLTLETPDLDLELLTSFRLDVEASVICKFELGEVTLPMVSLFL